MDIYQDASCGEFIPYIETLGGFGNYANDSPTTTTTTFERTPSNRRSNVRREKWTEKQTHVLVQQWKENAFVLDSNFHSGMWLKIKCVVDQHGPPKTVTHCKEKLRHLRDAYESVRDNNNVTCASHLLCPYFHAFDEVLGTHDHIRDEGASEPHVGVGVRGLEGIGFELPSFSTLLNPAPVAAAAAAAATVVANVGETVQDVEMDEDVENMPVTGDGKEKERVVEAAGGGGNMTYRQEFRSLQKAIMNARKEHEERHDKFIRELIGEQKNAQKQRERYSRLLN